MVNTENTEGEIESTEREIVDEIETETKAETEIEAEAEDKSKGKTLGQKNYYIFKPFSYITDRVQADKNGLVVTEEGTPLDKLVKAKKGTDVGKLIRDLGFVSPEVVEDTIGKVLDVGEKYKAENEKLNQETAQLLAKIAKLEAYNEEMKKVIEELRDTEEELKKLKAERQAYQNSVRNPEETLPLTPLQIGEEEEKKTKNPKKST